MRNAARLARPFGSARLTTLVAAAAATMVIVALLLVAGAASAEAKVFNYRTSGGKAIVDRTWSPTVFQGYPTYAVTYKGGLCDRAGDGRHVELWTSSSGIYGLNGPEKFRVATASFGRCVAFPVRGQEDEVWRLANKVFQQLRTYKGSKLIDRTSWY